MFMFRACFCLGRGYFTEFFWGAKFVFGGPPSCADGVFLLQSAAAGKISLRYDVQ